MNWNLQWKWLILSIIWRKRLFIRQLMDVMQLRETLNFSFYCSVNNEHSLEFRATKKPIRMLIVSGRIYVTFPYHDDGVTIFQLNGCPKIILTSWIESNCNDEWFFPPDPNGSIEFRMMCTMYNIFCFKQTVSRSNTTNQIKFCSICDFQIYCLFNYHPGLFVLFVMYHGLSRGIEYMWNANQTSE